MNNTRSADATADYFVSYLFKKYGGTLHVRRVASWVGLIVLAVARINKGQIQQRRVRQIQFDYKNRTFKVKYNHEVGKRGGIDIVEVLGGQGEPEGNTVLTIGSLLEAENAYQSLEQQLDKFCSSN
ncbi:MAG: hypothetical protein ABSH11_03795 [Verrucomicrobiota bacterium]|jgi:hypothetical protein